MRRAVRDGFTAFTIPLEGVVYSLYADVKSLITTAIGLLVDPMSAALSLPLKHPDGRPATRAEIAAEWQRVKDGACGARATAGDPNAYRRCGWPGGLRPGHGAPCFAHRGWRASEAVTRLRLTREDVDRLTQAKMTTMWRVIVSRWPDADAWPADAQMAILSWAWGVGPHARWPMLDAALRAGDFAAAAIHITMKGAGTIVDRNAKNQQLLRNAAVIERGALDPDVLYYPRILSDATPTEPALPAADDEPVEEHSLGARRAMMGEAIADAATADLTRRNGGG